MIRFVVLSSLAVFYLVEAGIDFIKYQFECYESRSRLFAYLAVHKPFNCRLCMCCWWALAWMLLYHFLIIHVWDDFFLAWLGTAGIALLLTDVRRRINTQIIGM